MIADGFAKGCPRFFSRVLQSTNNPTCEDNDLPYMRVNLHKPPMFGQQQLDPCNYDNNDKKECLPPEAYGLRNLAPTHQIDSFSYRMGPPDISWFTTIITPRKYSYIYHKATYKATYSYLRNPILYQTIQFRWSELMVTLRCPWLPWLQHRAGNNRFRCPRVLGKDLVQSEGVHKNASL